MITFNALKKGDYFHLIGNSLGLMVQSDIEAEQRKTYLRMDWTSRDGRYSYIANAIHVDLDHPILSIMKPDYTVAVCAAPDVEMATCERSGLILPVVAMETWETHEYDFDSDDEMASSIAETVVHYRCPDREWVREERHANWELAQSIARAEDGAMREAGWGVIGGPARGE